MTSSIYFKNYWEFEHSNILKFLNIFTSMCWMWYYGDWALYVNLCTPWTAKPTVLWMLAVWRTAHILSGVISETDSTWIHLLDVYFHREWTCKHQVGLFCWCVCYLLKNSVTRLCVFYHCVGCDVITVASVVSKLWKSAHVRICVCVCLLISLIAKWTVIIGVNN
jgi:hypothetical protein